MLTINELRKFIKENAVPDDALVAVGVKNPEVLRLFNVKRLHISVTATARPPGSNALMLMTRENGVNDMGVSVGGLKEALRNRGNENAPVLVLTLPQHADLNAIEFRGGYKVVEVVFDDGVLAFVVEAQVCEGPPKPGGLTVKPLAPESTDKCRECGEEGRKKASNASGLCVDCYLIVEKLLAIGRQIGRKGCAEAEMFRFFKVLYAGNNLGLSLDKVHRLTVAALASAEEFESACRRYGMPELIALPLELLDPQIQSAMRSVIEESASGPSPQLN